MIDIQQSLLKKEVCPERRNDFHTGTTEQVMKLLLTAITLVLILFVVSGQAPRQESSVVISTPEQIKEDFAAVPCKDQERLSAVKALFEKMGAASSSISIEKYKNVENLVVLKPGSSPEILVIGAHYDKVSAGCGAVDNWSGIVTITHLYKALKDIPLKKTLMFVAFGKEELGLVGSRAMVGAINKERLDQYCAMINIDSLGLAPLQVLDNSSSKKLASLVAGIAKEMKIPFTQARLPGADSDSGSFLKRKIPAVTLHGLSSQFRSVIHTGNDKAAKVNVVSVYLGYRVALGLVGRLNEAPCGAYR